MTRQLHVPNVGRMILRTYVVMLQYTGTSSINTMQCTLSHFRTRLTY